MLSMMQRPHENDFSHFPDPPTHMVHDGYFHRVVAPNLLSNTISPVHLEAWTDSQGFLPGQVSSPNMPGMWEEGDIHASNLSTASAPSAASSTAGSPQSPRGQLAPMGEWQQNPGGLSIVGHDYFPGTEYQAFGMEEFPPQFEMSLTKPQPGFGELQIATVTQQSSVSVPSPTATIVPQEPDMASPISATAPPSRRSSLAFVPLTPTSLSFSPPQAHVAQCSPFFSQSSGHFVAPLNSSYPTILHPDMRPMGGIAGYDPSFQSPGSVYPPPSPAMSSSPQPPAHSPYANGFPQQFPFPPPMDGRRGSVVSTFSHIPHEQPSPSSDDAGKEKQRCPHPDCGKVFKDLKAHMLTHQTERPEKCPITTCDYHVKGFARKYDKNRHTLTHYKGTMVCGFCPGPGSAAEKSFNRADVFKRHLTAVHGVEQTPPNSRKKTSSAVNSSKKLTGYAADATGKCSTCSATFSNAQDFYEHLDDCVLRIVQQEDPAEAINSRRLAEVENDPNVHATLEKNQLPTATPSGMEEDEDDIDMGSAEDDDDEEARITGRSAVRSTIKTGPANGVQKSKGMTHSRGGVPLPTKARARKSRRNYPSSWGFDKGQMTMKKRVLAVFDGPRRLAKDDMMLSTEHEVRLKLSDGRSYVTDLDVQTMKRADGFHQATEEEKGHWVSDDPTEDDIQAMIHLQQQ